MATKFSFCFYFYDCHAGQENDRQKLYYLIRSKNLNLFPSVWLYKIEITTKKHKETDTVAYC